MNVFFLVLVILILIIAVLLAGIVLVQNSKGGGLAANFSAPNQIMGVRKTTDFLEKATWTLAASLLVLCLVSTFAMHSGRAADNQKSTLNADVIETPAPTAANAMNATTVPVEE
ncbi:MAG: preprotein translocase subunit SecG [Bacteroidales bacterium]|nr:preprotein translocase subunit SecG [Bacteroidales bacterium]